MTERKLVIFQFSGCYREQDFYQDRDPVWIEAEKISGTNCYLDAEAEQLLLEEMSRVSVRDLHFMDSGNYHYLSFLWMREIREPFVLLMFDHHTDLQPPAFGGILSCGGWLRELLEQNANLREVWLAGPPAKDLQENGMEFADRIRFLSEEELQAPESLRVFLEKMPAELPVYLSLDKDVVSEQDISCNWDQGNVRQTDLLEALSFLTKERNISFLGVDICGEAEAPAGAEENRKQSEINRRLLEILL